ncbi:WbqC family protein [Pseudomonadota bacterium DY0742]|uniref:WbqC family protein n=1 Tax=Stutzerimonas balearica TaxID=74829 RepID=UPI001BCA3FBA|nr:WbqC family protein [Stutzerimonas balearica]MBS4149084.1 hypothetical protein [Stutzerimonas balearica]
MFRTIGMMQPYLFPYLGYFQLIAASDAFVLGDNLQYSKGSWVNRNRVLCQGQPKLFSFGLQKASIETPINERYLSEHFAHESASFLRLLRNAYARAPHRDAVVEQVERILAFAEPNLALFAENSIREICRYLDIRTPIHRASEFDLPPPTDKQDRVVQLMHRLRGDLYLNPIGGMELYSPAHFRRHGLLLRFLKMDDITYPQLGHPFVPALSIIDVLMFNSRQEIQRLLPRFTALEGRETEPEGRVA